MKKIIKSLLIVCLSGQFVLMGCNQSISPESSGGSNSSIENGTHNLENLPIGIKKLPAGTEGTAGRTGTYIEFGEWPQTVKSANVKIEDTTKTYKIHGWDCYKGDDGAYYVKLKARPLNKKAVFSDNKTLIKFDTFYYFKMEPLKWRVITDSYIDNKGDNKGKLLLTEQAIFFTDYGSGGYYEESGISWWLNEQFLKKAFKDTEKNNINSVDLSDIHGKSIDKVFILSKKEIEKIGFTSEELIRKATDYTRCYPGTGTGVSGEVFGPDFRLNKGEEGNVGWWLRAYGLNYTDIVNYNGNTGTRHQGDPWPDYGWKDDYPYICVVPAITINF